MATKQKIIRSIIGIFISLVLWFSSGIKIPILDSSTDIYFREAITKAGVAYATCRGINAVVSLLKDSSLQLEPGGVGISLAVGQLLDPIDDMTERLSDVLVTAIIALGIQKLAYEIGVSLAPTLISICLLILSIMIWFNNQKLSYVHDFIVKLITIIAIARFCLPVSSVANNYIYQHYFTKQITEAKNELSVFSAEFDKLKNFSIPETDGILGAIKNGTSFLKQKAIDFKNALTSIKRNMVNIVDNLLKLTFLYVGIFLIQVLFLPLLSFWFLIKITNSLFHTSTPYNLPPVTYPL